MEASTTATATASPAALREAADRLHPSRFLAVILERERAAILANDDMLFRAAVNYLHHLAVAYPRCPEICNNSRSRKCSCLRNFFQEAPRRGGNDGMAINASPSTAAAAREIVSFVKLDPDQQALYVTEKAKEATRKGGYLIPLPPDGHGGATRTMKVCRSTMQLLTGKKYAYWKALLDAAARSNGTVPVHANRGQQRLGGVRNTNHRIQQVPRRPHHQKAPPPPAAHQVPAAIPPAARQVPAAMPLEQRLQANGGVLSVSLPPGAGLGVTIRASRQAQGCCLVDSVLDPASGLRPGDTILSLNDDLLPLSGSTDVWLAMFKAKEGTRRVVDFYRQPTQQTPHSNRTSSLLPYSRALLQPSPKRPAFPDNAAAPPPATAAAPEKNKRHLTAEEVESKQSRSSPTAAAAAAAAPPAPPSGPASTYGTAAVDNVRIQNKGGGDDEDGVDGEILEVWTLPPAVGDGGSQEPKSGTMPRSGANGDTAAAADSAHATKKEKDDSASQEPKSEALQGNGADGAATADSAHATKDEADDSTSQEPKSEALQGNGAAAADSAPATKKEGGDDDDGFLDDEPQFLCPPRRVKRRRPVRSPTPPTSASSLSSEGVQDEHFDRSTSRLKVGKENESAGNKASASTSAPAAQATCSPIKSSVAATSAASLLAGDAARPQACAAAADNALVDDGDIEKIRMERRLLSRDVQLRREQVELLRLKLQAKKVEKEERELREQLKEYEE